MTNQRLASIPDPLINKAGGQVTAAEQWRTQRRTEILELFRTHVYGREPLQRPESLTFQTLSEDPAMNGIAVRKLVAVHYQGDGGAGTIRLQLYIPTQRDAPAPVFLLMNIGSGDIFDPERSTGASFWPAKFIVSRGYAAAVFQVADADPDFHDGFLNGVHGIFDPAGKERSADAWGTIAAWAWGAGRAMDYIVSDSDLDANRVAVVGHSRGGKAALWAGAVDERFAMVVSNNSGSTGAALARGKIGETVKHINTQFPHWFCENYKSYNDKEDELPVDQHMLLSLMAPRLLYAASATEDSWADPESEYLSMLLAEPVYRLFGLQGLHTKPVPVPDTPIHGSGMGYHLRQGAHELTEYDWTCFIDFADANMKH